MVVRRTDLCAAEHADNGFVGTSSQRTFHALAVDSHAVQRIPRTTFRASCNQVSKGRSGVLRSRSEDSESAQGCRVEDNWPGANPGLKVVHRPQLDVRGWSAFRRDDRPAAMTGAELQATEIQAMTAAGWTHTPFTVLISAVLRGLAAASSSAVGLNASSADTLGAVFCGYLSRG